MHRLLVVLSLMLALVVTASACGSAEDAANRQGFDNFQAAVGADRNYDMYWMGREFEAAGHTYRGPEALAPSDPGGEVEGGGLIIFYEGEPLSLRLELYSRAAWVRLTGIRAKNAQQLRFKTKEVEINGKPATLKTTFGDRHPIDAQFLVIEYGDTIVEASTSAVSGSTPLAGDADLNPLTDEATFLAVMQNLRPYPQ